MMKNLLVLGFALATATGAANAQTGRVLSAEKTPVPFSAKLDGDAYFTGTRTPSKASNTHKISSPGFYGIQIGKSWYDLPSNSASPNRIVRHNDGTVSAVWNETCNGPSAAQGFPSRGSGYNYFNGTSWTEGFVAADEYNGTCNKSFGIASKRVGWPEVMGLKTGKEVVISHNSSSINFTSRPAKGVAGTSTWSTTSDLAFTQNINKPGLPAITGNAGTWPRAISSGDTIHMIYAVSNATVAGNARIDGVLNPVVYSRSDDGGLTWSKQNIFLPGLDSVNGKFTRIGGDGYALAVNRGTVAIVAGYFGQPWTLWKSTNGGNTFVKRTISAAATPADTIMLSPTDTAAMYNDNAHSVVIDNTGKVHVWAGGIFLRVSMNTTGQIIAGDSWYPGLGTDPSAPVHSSLLYWNDGMAATARPEKISQIENSQPISSLKNWVGFDTNKRTPYGTMGLVSMPSAGYAPNGDVYVVYAGVVEGASNGGDTGQPFRDLYIKKRAASGPNMNVWSDAINISRSKNLFPAQPGSSAAEQGEENVFPSVAHKIGGDNILHTVWMTDYEPGMNLGADVDQEGPNTISYEGFNLNTMLFKYLGTKEDYSAYVNEISAFPNPTNGTFTIGLDLKKNANVKVRVTNLLGQEVATVAPKAMAPGKNSDVKIDMSKFASGIYLYTVSSDEFTVTKRIVKQ
jgi:hypothetical protein